MLYAVGVRAMRSLTARCYEGGECFAKRGGRCEILTKGLVPCPFRKPVREITNGVWYAYNPSRCKEVENDGT